MLRFFWGMDSILIEKGNYGRQNNGQCSGANNVRELYYHLKNPGLKWRLLPAAGKSECILLQCHLSDRSFYAKK